MLDSEEYFHLALHATQQGLHHSAMEYLYKCLEQEPENANAIFLLAAEHAELGLYKRAIEGMKKSIELDDQLDMAYYQLALLHLQQGNEAESYPLWQHMSLQSPDPSIREFAQGMLIFESAPENALIHFDKALAMPQQNDFLQKSMSKIIDNLRAVSINFTKPSTASDDSVSEILVNTYKDSSFNRDDNE
jgi:tetratricopeptide (TPR) repeat protein